MKISVIIPARGGSKGIPGKNIMNFCGRPLISWSIEQAKTSACVSRVYVTSDSDEILSVAARDGAVPVVRPAAISTDTASTESALLHALDQMEAVENNKPEAVVLLQATSPLRIKDDIDRACRLFEQKGADSLFSASVLEDFCVWRAHAGRMDSVTFDYKNRGIRQNRDPLYLENGSIYVFKPEGLRTFKNRLFGRMEVYLMAMWQSYEIDSPEDVEICEFFMRHKITGGR